MTPDQLAGVIRDMQRLFDSRRDEFLDRLIARLNEPAASGWRDATVEAPPEDVRVMVCGVYGSSEPEFATYLGEGGQPSRRLPNKEAWGYWRIEHNGVSEGPMKIRWWQPLPLPPAEVL